ncbi:hypothetical protein [Algoriphagus hitonicola]|uniref:Curlin associated repeat-containing protein n=1 Tax=Algoriphagus hitonicola TaxID=435880 RepID=A0A1I2THP5_9BACT|nr:hypothetical protein [Algoriphagus hitonicola]SFG64405.1 hypothetical protein SAMN04487988_10637 [Algoriphagus hitonicola]
MFKLSKTILFSALFLSSTWVLGQGQSEGNDLVNMGQISNLDLGFNNGAFTNQEGNRNKVSIEQTKTSGFNIGDFLNGPGIFSDGFPGQGDFPSQGIDEFPGRGDGPNQDGGLLPVSGSFLPFNLAAVNQMGNRNQTQIGQEGSGLITLVNQMGNGNMASLNSSGINVVQASNQMGRRNEISSEINYNGLGGTVALYNQIGRDNTIDVNVNTTFGLGIQPVLINQVGENNVANVDVSGFSGPGNEIVISQTGGMPMNITQTPGGGMGGFIPGSRR